MKNIISPFFIFIFILVNGYAYDQTSYEDGRPQASLRIEAKDQGIFFHHGDGPNQCDYLGARDVWVFEHNGSYFMHYDGAGTHGNRRIPQNQRVRIEKLN